MPFLGVLQAASSHTGVRARVTALPDNASPLSPPTDGACAAAEWSDDIASTGWATLTVRANDSCHWLDAGYASGYAEGHLSHERIWEAFENYNASNSWLEGGRLPAFMHAFVAAQDKWMAGMVAATAAPTHADHAYWQQAGVLLQHVRGLADGYRAAAPPSRQLDNEQIYMLTLAGDLEDLVHLNHSAAAAQRRARARARPPSQPHMDCSGLVKIAADGSDLFVGHTTFNDFQYMLRVFKHYEFWGPPALQTAASTASFSARPADLNSKDDFYLLSSGLVVIETSLTVFNTSLYTQLAPETVPSWLRGQIANRLATGSEEWCSIFSRFNSGTHNNEWIVTDYNLFEPGQALKDNTVWMLDQMPGKIHAADVTRELLGSQGYVPSYNIPYFPDIFAISEYGEHGFVYENDTRARIFRRDQSGVHDLLSMSALLNKNDYQHDPLSGGDPCNQISARCDLHDFLFGGIDSKNVDRAHVQSQRVRAIGAPSHADEPPFAWIPKFNATAHMGMPYLFNFNWTTMSPATGLDRFTR